MSQHRGAWDDRSRPKISFRPPILSKKWGNQIVTTSDWTSDSNSDWLSRWLDVSFYYQSVEEIETITLVQKSPSNHPYLARNEVVSRLGTRLGTQQMTVIVTQLVTHWLVSCRSTRTVVIEAFPNNQNFVFHQKYLAFLPTLSNVTTHRSM